MQFGATKLEEAIQVMLAVFNRPGRLTRIPLDNVVGWYDCCGPD